jgi:radical SAM-linked protein
VRFNFTDVRLSAMEDFVGRGDRSLAPVIEAAWRAGAGMDAWFEALDRTYEAWTGAIAAAGLEGRYRALELGGWGRTNALSEEGLDAFCSQPLPWDHIDTGIDKRWLAEDLKRALEASVVPDCSFEGCSSCGVCGPDLGHNVVIAPPEIPVQKPRQAPPSDRVCRIRFRFSKTGAMALLSHLDLVRLFERALRRAELPISFTGGFHPLPRLQLALALPLGVQGEGEWMDLEFIEQVEALQVLKRWQQTLPPGLVLMEAYEVPVSGQSLSQQLESARWSFELTSQAGDPSISLEQWQQMVDALLSRDTLVWDDTDKKGRPRQRDCRPVLETLEIVSPVGDGASVNQELVDGVRLELLAHIDHQGRSLKPAQLQHWLSEALAQSLRLHNVRRLELRLVRC